MTIAITAFERSPYRRAFDAQAAVNTRKPAAG